MARGLGEKTAVQYVSRWEGVNRPRWEHEEDLEQYGRVILMYWLGDPEQNYGDKAKYRKYRVNIERRTEAREQRSRFVAKGYEVSCHEKAGPDVYHPDIVDCYVDYEITKAGWQLAEVVGLHEEPIHVMFPYTLRMLELGRRYSVHLKKENLNIICNREGGWC